MMHAKYVSRITSYYSLICSSFFTVFLFACGLDVENPNPPEAPTWVEKSSATRWPERGIDAHESGGIFLEWYPSNEEEVLFYNIFRTSCENLLDSCGLFELAYRLNAQRENVNYFIDTDVELRRYYQYQIQAENSSGGVSDYSETIGYRLLRPPNGEVMSPNGVNEVLSELRILRWEYSYILEMENYHLTILSSENELIYRSVFAPGDYIHWEESLQLPDSVILEVGKNYKWRIDAAAHYIGDVETSGSESLWALFRYME